MKNIIVVLFIVLTISELVVALLNNKPLTTLAISVVSGLSVYSMFVITNIIGLSCAKAMISMVLGIPGCITMIILDKLL